jgi:GDP-4-dehydro-6-deoxy-D-mannose reductase
VIHLAAQSNVPDSFADPRKTYEVNFWGTLNLLDALKVTGFRGAFLYVSSADAYGLVPETELPITEEMRLRPRNPYAVSKAAAEALCCQWSNTESMRITIARPFNHIGPGQSDRFVASDLARQVAEIKLGRRASTIEVGDIDVTRDFTDVRDVVRAYALILEEGRNGEVFNVCSGREQSVRSLLTRLLDLAGTAAEVRVVSERLRRAEQRRVRGSSEKLKQAVKWEPAIDVSDSLKDILRDWEQRLQHA